MTPIRAILRLMNKDPLHLRLYFDPVYAEVARMIGYGGLPLPEAREKAEALAGRFPKTKIQAAAEAISRLDQTTNPPTMRLTDEARRLCWQLLGPPPGHVFEDEKSKPQEPQSQTEKVKVPKKPRSKGRS
jgi:hypothetical protein